MSWVNTFDFDFMHTDFKRVLFKRKQNEKQTMEVQLTEEYMLNVNNAHPLDIETLGVTFSQLSKVKLKKMHSDLLAMSKETFS